MPNVRTVFGGFTVLFPHIRISQQTPDQYLYTFFPSMGPRESRHFPRNAPRESYPGQSFTNVDKGCFVKLHVGLLAYF